MKQKRLIWIIFLAVWILMGTYPIARAQNLTGYVYDGNVGDTSTPISGVTVTLYVSNNAGDFGTQRDQTTTAGNGSYSLNTSGASFDYYNIVETDPSGYTDVGAQSAGGTVKTSNHIQHVGLGGTLTGNNFWDKSPAPALPTISISDESGNENCGSMGFTVTLSAASTSNVTVDYQTNDGTAVSPNDYTSTSGTLIIPASSTTGTISVTIIDDAILESTETFAVDLSNATNATISDNQGIGTILDNDGSTEPVFDYGDVPTPYDQTPHSTIHFSFYLGSGIDSETAPLPHPNALGDDNDTTDDEDGVVFTTALIPGQTATVHVTVFNTKTDAEPLLQVWIDFNQNKLWDATELIVNDTPAGSGTFIYNFTVPAGAQQGATFAHAVLTDQGVVPSTGVRYGEVEDYEVAIGGGELDFGDAPDSYKTLNASGGPNHTIGGVFFGQLIDPEPDGQPTALADGDDNNLTKDEDGVLIGSPFIPGSWTSINLMPVAPVGVPAGIAGWIDFDQSGTFEDPAERVVNAMFWGTPFPSLMTQIINIPTTLNPGLTYARFRIYRTEVGVDVLPSPTGAGGEGEVEDYYVEILGEGYDFGDVPTPYDQTVKYTVHPTFFMGYTSDPESAAQPDFHALGDDQNDGNDDEDGIVFGAVKPGQTATLDVTITNGGMNGPRLQIWIDFNRNNLWDIPETIVDDNPTGTSTTFMTTYSYPVPNIPKGMYYAHAVLYDQASAGPIGGLPYGEVEDYEIEVGEEGGGPGEPEAVKWTQPPLLQHIMELDTVVYFGWRETSMHIMPMAADDWFCYDPRPVTGIRWWGAYADWDTTFPPPNAPSEFHIGIWTDVPRGVDRDWSHPGEMIHEVMVDRGSLNETVKRAVLMFDPEGENKMITGFEYLFEIGPDGWFIQEDDSTVYWLSISAIYPEEPDTTRWGWLTREHYFHDDAVRMFLEGPAHPGTVFHEGEPIGSRWDLAFILYTDEYERPFDYGDAPEFYGTFFDHNGAHHRVVPTIYMGETVDTEEDGQPHMEAMGDDEEGEEDEDGVQFTESLFIGQENEVTVLLSSSGYLSAWIDFNQDGSWREPHDFIIENFELEPGEHTLQFHVIEEAEPGVTAARFRFSREPDLWFHGFAMDGEVEDYMVTLQSGTAVDVEQNDIPSEFMLYSNYPNPFNPSTRITFAMPQKDLVTLEIYNVRGARVRTLVDGMKEAGMHTVSWDGKDGSGDRVTSGLYLCKMKTTNFQKTIRMLYLK